MARPKKINGREKLNEAAQDVLDYIGSLDPTWGSRITIARDERGMDSLQTLGGMIIHVCEREEHTMIPNHPYLAKDFADTYTARPCLWCGNQCTADYPGQPALCGNNCAKHYYDSNPTVA